MQRTGGVAVSAVCWHRRPEGFADVGGYGTQPGQVSAKKRRPLNILEKAFEPLGSTSR
jgi:hypothetical protein